MPRLSATNQRTRESQSQLGFISILVVHMEILLSDCGFTMTSGFTPRPHDHLLHYWMLLLLGMAYCIWRVLRFLGRIGAAGEAAFVLASLGLATRYLCHVAVFGTGFAYGSHSLVEEVADARLRFLLAAVRWGGFAAYLLGLALVVWASRPPATAGRAGEGTFLSAGKEC